MPEPSSALSVPAPVGWGLLLVAVALRLVPRLLWPNLQGSDVYYHFAYVRLIRESGRRVPLRHPRILGPGVFGYPALYHWLLSFLSPGAIRLLDRLGGVAFDLVPAALASWLLWRVGAADAGAAAALAGLYLVAPGLTLFHIGPRAFSATPRIFAQTLYALAILVWLMSLPPVEALSQTAAAAIAAALFAAILLSSKFGLQNLLFALPVASLLGDVVPLLLALVAAFPLALLLSGGFLLRQLRGQYDHLAWYLKLNRAFVAHRANWRRLAEALRRGRFGEFVVEAAWHNPLLSGFVRHLPLFLAVALALRSDGPPLDAQQQAALAFALAALPPWLITAFGPFRILGESERYLEFAFPAAWLLLWSAAPPDARMWLFIAFALGFLAVYAANLRVLAIAAARADGALLDEVAATLRRFRAPVLLCLHDPESYRFLWDTDARLCKYNGDLSLRGEAGAFLAWFFWRYPHVHPGRLSEICARYGVDTILLKRQAARRLEEQFGAGYPLAGWEVVFENGAYQLYRRRAG